MKAKHVFKRAALTLAGASLLVPQASLLAANPTSAPAKPAAQTASIMDVALAQSGSLRGQVVNAQGAPVSRMNVLVQSSGREVATTLTNERGEFAVNNLRGGNYTIAAGDSAGVYRVWTANAAPPSAKPGVLLISGRQVTVGQNAGFTGRTGLMVLGTAAAIVTAGVVSNDDESSS